jgi:hypothetical protein
VGPRGGTAASVLGAGPDCQATDAAAAAHRTPPSPRWTRCSTTRTTACWRRLPRRPRGYLLCKKRKAAVLHALCNAVLGLPALAGRLGVGRVGGSHAAVDVTAAGLREDAGYSRPATRTIRKRVLVVLTHRHATSGSRMLRSTQYTVAV